MFFFRYSAKSVALMIPMNRWLILSLTNRCLSFFCVIRRAASSRGESFSIDTTWLDIIEPTEISSAVSFLKLPLQDHGQSLSRQSHSYRQLLPTNWCSAPPFCLRLMSSFEIHTNEASIVLPSTKVDDFILKPTRMPTLKETILRHIGETKRLSDNWCNLSYFRKVQVG